MLFVLLLLLLLCLGLATTRCDVTDTDNNNDNKRKTHTYQQALERVPQLADLEGLVRVPRLAHVGREEDVAGLGDVEVLLHLLHPLPRQLLVVHLYE